MLDSLGLQIMGKSTPFSEENPSFELSVQILLTQWFYSALPPRAPGLSRREGNSSECPWERGTLLPALHLLRPQAGLALAGQVLTAVGEAIVYFHPDVSGHKTHVVCAAQAWGANEERSRYVNTDMHPWTGIDCPFQRCGHPTCSEPHTPIFSPSH